MCFGKKKTNSFADVLKGILHAVNSVQEILQLQQIENLKKFWEGDAGKAVTQKIKVGDREMEVPLVTLVPHSHLEIDDMEIHFKAKVGEVVSATPDDSLVMTTAKPEATERTDLQMELSGVKANDSDVMDITIRFKHKDMPEGLARLTDEYNKLI